MPTKHNGIARKEVDAILAARIIKPASSLWVFPVVIAKKKDGSPRFCVDYRALNERMKAYKFPLPKIEKVIDDMAGSKIFSKLDMLAGYWQIKLAENVGEKTAFRYRFGSFSFEVMPFGPMNAPSTFQRMAESLFKDLEFVQVYIDDVIIGSRSIEEHTNHLIVVCDRI